MSREPRTDHNEECNNLPGYVDVGRGQRRHPEPVAHIEEVSSGPFQTVSHKKIRPSNTSSKKATSVENALVKYTQICVFPTNKLRRGIDDISSKVNAINKALPLDKVPKNFYCVMGRITA